MTSANGSSNRPAFSERARRVRFTGSDVLSLAGVPTYRGGIGHALIHCPNPDHEDRHPSCSVDLANGKARCFACGWSASDVVALHRTLADFSTMGDALRDLEARAGTVCAPLKLPAAPAKVGSGRAHKPQGRPEEVRRWAYREADGTHAFDVIRIQFRLADGAWETEPGSSKPMKEYRMASPDGALVLPASYRGAGRRLLLNLPAILAAPDTRVFVVEGEPAVDALTELGELATTSSGGASNAHFTNWSPLAGRHVVVWPDNDLPGMRYGADVTALLLNLTPAPKVEAVDVKQLNLPVGGDAVDWLAAGGGLP